MMTQRGLELYNQVDVLKTMLMAYTHKVERCKRKYGKRFAGLGERTRKQINYCHNMLAVIKIEMNSFYGDYFTAPTRNMFFFSSPEQAKQITKTACEVTKSLKNNKNS